MVKDKQRLLLIFTKNPVSGKVKTRLARDLGNYKALEIYKFLLQHSVNFTRTVDATKQVYYSDYVNLADIWDNDIFLKRKQEGHDLGERMMNAFKAGFNDGYKEIIVIGTDMYDIDSHTIENAFAELENNEVVLGPAEDGGYYLFGMKSLHSEAFKNKEWGTSSVLENTLLDLKGLDIKLLETRNDVDLLEDIKDHEAFQKFIEI